MPSYDGWINWKGPFCCYHCYHVSLSEKVTAALCLLVDRKLCVRCCRRCLSDVIRLLFRQHDYEYLKQVVDRHFISKLHPHFARVGIDQSLNSLTTNFQKVVHNTASCISSEMFETEHVLSSASSLRRTTMTPCLSTSAFHSNVFSSRSSITSAGNGTVTKRGHATSGGYATTGRSFDTSADPTPIISSRNALLNKPPCVSRRTPLSISSTSVSAPSSVGDMDATAITSHRPLDTDWSSDATEAQVFLSVVWQASKLSVAHYDINTSQVYMMMDSLETDDFQLLNRVLHQVMPACIVVSSKQDDRLMRALRKAATDLVSTAENPENVDIIQVLPSIDFSFEICKRRILSLPLPSVPNHYTESERLLYFSSLIPMENISMVRAVGGLLKYLEKMRIGVELEDPDIRVPIMGFKVFSLDDLLIMDMDSFSALQIFQKECHPSVYKAGQGNSSKEGLSLYGILNRCRSQIGSKMLRLWFMRPLKNITLLNQRYEALSFFVNPRNVEVTNTFQECLKHIKAVPRILSRMTQAQASIGDWQALYKTAYNAIYICDLCRVQNQAIDIFKKIGGSFSDDLHRISTLISRIVDFEESSSESRFVVKPNVDAELDEMRRTYNGLPDFMTKVAREELNRLSEDITECNVIYLPQLGYLLAIPGTEKMREDEDFAIPGLEFVFFSNNMAHYKSASGRELDRLLGDTQCDITDRETSIMHRLQNTILDHSPVLLDVMQYAAELDCLLSLAACAREFGYVRPTLVDDGTFCIKAGRHPLQELCCCPFVPNDSSSGGEWSRMKVLTGPNASGKSVYIKQVALIVYLAHIGSFVPAESASICIVDRIFTRIKSLDSISVGLSTFMIDLNQVHDGVKLLLDPDFKRSRSLLDILFSTGLAAYQMSDALRNFSNRSLIIIDEFGKGTETVDGLSLLCASLRHWLSSGDNCPHVFACTHFHSLIQQKLLPQTPLLSYQTLETLHNGEDLVFLYQLVDGHTSSSYASHVARQAGLPQEIIKRGIEVSKLLQESIQIHGVDTGDIETQTRRCSDIVTRFLQLDLEKDDVVRFLQNLAAVCGEGETTGAAVVTNTAPET